MQLLGLVAIGVVAGVAAGMFGIGGGLIIVPALVLLYGLSQHAAVGTSLGAILLPVGAFGSGWRWWRKNSSPRPATTSVRASGSHGSAIPADGAGAGVVFAAVRGSIIVTIYHVEGRATPVNSWIVTPWATARARIPAPSSATPPRMWVPGPT